MTARDHYDPEAGPWLAFMEAVENGSRTCSACGGRCYWVDTHWVCRRKVCGSEWSPDHGEKYAAPDGKPRRSYPWRDNGADPIWSWTTSPRDAMRYDTKREALGAVRRGRRRARGVTTGAERVQR